MSGFQTQVAGVPAPAVEGDLASSNPRFAVLAGPGGFIAGASGVTIGRFAWTIYQNLDPDNAAQIVNSFGIGSVLGFVPRQPNPALITTFLADASMSLPAGFGVSVYAGGDFWVKNNGSTLAQVGMKAYAKFTDGSASFAATGSPISSTLSASSIAAATGISCTGSISGNTLTVTAVSAGTLVPGAILTGSGVATGTQITAQLSGTAGGVGTYSVSIPEQSVASTTISGTYGVLTVGAGSGTVLTGGIIAGSSASSGTVVWGQLTATTWVVSPSQSVASATLTETQNVETKWIAMSAGGAGELVKISDHALG